MQQSQCNRASVGATVAGGAYSPAPICACVSTRQGYSGAEIVLGNGDHVSTSHTARNCNGDFSYRHVSLHPGLPLHERTLLCGRRISLVWRRSNDGQLFRLLYSAELYKIAGRRGGLRMRSNADTTNATKRRVAELKRQV
ncbi:hypothetical protein EVAR_90791_1 [Eumeta japonica]|uniref:Uncharacterized protein n=1 Tax=Eumeta variegata TaxID=151549 RepID=A0A4C2AAK3_EUMVA|nr:hypothetical protein EVAR_90791_1 [Eumeta japonica]